MTKSSRKDLLKRAKNIIKNKIKADKDGRKYITVKGKKFYTEGELSERQLIYKILKLFLKKRTRKAQPKDGKKKDGKYPESSAYGYSPEVASKFATYDLLEKIKKDANTKAIDAKPAEKKANTLLLEGYVENDRWKGKYLEEATGYVKPEYQDRVNELQNEILKEGEAWLVYNYRKNQAKDNNLRILNNEVEKAKREREQTEREILRLRRQAEEGKMRKDRAQKEIEKLQLEREAAVQQEQQLNNQIERMKRETALQKEREREQKKLTLLETLNTSLNNKIAKNITGASYLVPKLRERLKKSDPAMTDDRLKNMDKVTLLQELVKRGDKQIYDRVMTQFKNTKDEIKQVKDYAELTEFIDKWKPEFVETYENVQQKPPQQKLAKEIAKSAEQPQVKEEPRPPTPPIKDEELISVIRQSAQERGILTKEEEELMKKNREKRLQEIEKKAKEGRIDLNRRFDSITESLIEEGNLREKYLNEKIPTVSRTVMRKPRTPSTPARAPFAEPLTPVRVQPISLSSPLFQRTNVPRGREVNDVRVETPDSILREQAQNLRESEGERFALEVDKDNPQMGIFGDGKYGEGRGLYENEINKIMNKYESYLGTIASDEMHLIEAKVKPQSRGSFIMNTDPRSKGGKHWVAVFFDARPNGSKSIEYYDSFAEPPTEQTLKGLKHIVDKLKPDTYLKLKVNKVKRQSVTTDNCGWFCMEFIINRYRGKSFSEATGYDEKIISKVKEGEASVERFKEQYGGCECDKFGYI